MNPLACDGVEGIEVIVRWVAEHEADVSICKPKSGQSRSSVIDVMLPEP